MISTHNIRDLPFDILPIVRLSHGSPPGVIALCGTGFLVAPGILMTCWHCVSGSKDRTDLGVLVPDRKRQSLQSHRLSAVSQDTAGFDLATARVDLSPRVCLRPVDEEHPAGTEVVTSGYPLLQVTSPGDVARPSDMGGRILQGYVMHCIEYEHPGFRLTPTYELDMLAPGGLSGAPIARRNSDMVVGIIYGSNDVSRGEQRVISIGHAHHLKSIREHATEATGGRTIGDLVDDPATWRGV